MSVLIAIGLVAVGFALGFIACFLWITRAVMEQLIRW